MRPATVVCAALLLAACQRLGGFEPFEAATEQVSGGLGGVGGTPQAGAGGQEAGAGGQPSGGAPTCPAPPKKDGREMVAIHRKEGGCFWVDEKEVTWNDYDAFLKNSPPEPVLPAACSNKKDFSPAAPCKENALAGVAAATPEDKLKAPVTCVDWCDAKAYCVEAGKDLCPGDYNNPKSPVESAWFAACSSDGENDYSYGTYKADTCKDASNSSCNTKENCLAQVGAFAKCKTPEGAFDMSGNAAEWVEECFGGDATKPDGECFVRGGSAFDESSSTKCDRATSRARNTPGESVGFRCCYMPP